MSERFEEAKKYMCKWAREDIALSICEEKIKKREPNEIDCLVCVADSFRMTCDMLWTVALSEGVSRNIAELLFKTRRQYEGHTMVFSAITTKMKDGYGDAAKELFISVVEEKLTGE